MNIAPHTKIVALAAAAVCALSLSACTSSKASTGSTNPTGSIATSSTPAHNGGGSTTASSGSSSLTLDPCGALSIAQVSAITGGTVTAKPDAALPGGGSGCKYEAASLNEVDTSFATIALSPSCTAGGDSVVLNGIGKCALYSADIHMLVVFGSSYTATISTSGFATTQAQLTQLGNDLVPKL